MKPPVYLIAICLISCLGLVGCGPGAPRTTLHQAVEKGDLKLVKRHIAAKSDLNKTNSSGWTALHLAAMKGDLPIVEALSQAGADVNRKGKDGKTPLDAALDKSQTEVIKFLQERNAEKPGRRLIDGGLGVGEALDNM